MRVWYILMTFPRPSETFVCNEIKVLRGLGVEIKVGTLLGSPKGAAELLVERDLEGLAVDSASPAAQWRGLGIALRRPATALRLLRWIVGHSWRRPSHLLKSLVLAPRCLDLLTRIEGESPDVVYLYWGHFPSILGHLVMDSCPRTSLAISLSAYDLVAEYGGSRSVAQRAQMVTTWAGANVDSIAGLGVPRAEIEVIYQGVDLDRVRNRQVEAVPHRVVTAGRLTAAKGTVDVLTTFTNVYSRHPDATLVILGDGPERAALEHSAERLGIAPAVTFAGHVTHDEVFDQMAAAEVFLFLSRAPYERLPNVVKEAMACQCVVVTTRTPGIEEVIDDRVNGYIVEQGDLQAANESLETIFARPAAAREMASQGMRRVYSRFDLAKIMQDLADRWRRLREDGLAEIGS